MHLYGDSDRSSNAGGRDNPLLGYENWRHDWNGRNGKFVENDCLYTLCIGGDFGTNSGLNCGLAALSWECGFEIVGEVSVRATFLTVSVFIDQLPRLGAPATNVPKTRKVVYKNGSMFSDSGNTDTPDAKCNNEIEIGVTMGPLP
jgi:hypothetical protein